MATPAPAEPTFAERARTLVHQSRAGTLATVSRKHGGHPFASLMPYAEDADGAPLFLISALAVHTHNVAADPRASLLVLQPGVSGDPLAAGRVTLMGAARRLAEGEASAARAAYLARHPNAESWVHFDDFALWRLDVADIYFVGGFGAMGWVAAADYREAAPDPLAEAAAGIIEHMNTDHADALLLYARHFGGVEADEARMAAVDRLGFKLRLRQGARRWSIRVAFPVEVRSAEASRTVLIDMLRQARSAT
jgi:putative heme iron utilization protein